MGFYGNITNTSKTNFVFDKIYTNRTAMDKAQASTTTNPTGTTTKGDGVFIGRYVLIEYGEIQDNSFVRAYGPDDEGYYCTSKNLEENTRILYSDGTNATKSNNGSYIHKGQIIYTVNGNTYTYLECKDGENDGLPTFTNDPGLDPKNDPYFYNLRQDQKNPIYKTSRGYDGTVWVKTTVNNEIKYVNIAELNSVVPTLDIVADAPTLSPVTPHFDTASNNVYYKLHWQPAWGMRIAEAEAAGNGEVYSDYTTSWSQEEYIPETGETKIKWYFPDTKEWKELAEGQNPPGIAADIYFNHAAFDPQVGESEIHKEVNFDKYIPIIFTNKKPYKPRTYYYKRGTSYTLDRSNTPTEGRNYFEKVDNIITVTADGLSNNTYNLHDNTTEKTRQVDTQQIHISLPAIGNMMSEAWDIIHGPLRNDDMRQYKTDADGNMLDINGNITTDLSKAERVESLQGRLDSIAAINGNEIPIKRLSDGKLVGTKINGDNNRTDGEITNILNENLSTSLNEDDAWIYTKVNSNAITEDHNNGIAIHHTFHARTNSTVNDLNINDYDGKNGGSTSDSDTGFQKIINKDTIQLYVPKVDKAGHVVGTDIDKVILPYGYKHIETIGNKIDNKTTDLDTTQDTVSTDKGTVTAGTPIEETAIVATETQDTVNIDPFNKWIQIKASDDKVEIAHEIHGIVTKAKATDLNNGTNTITFHDLEFDAAGHVEKNQLHTYTLPYGYKHFTTNGKVSEETTVEDLYTTISSVSNGDDTEVKKDVSDNQKSCVARNTQDTLNIQTKNKWIQTAITNSNNGADSLVIAHEIHAIKDADATGTNLNGGNTISTITGDNIVIPDLKFDKAGHLTENHSHTYTLPYGYKTFTTNGLHTKKNNEDVVTDLYTVFNNDGTEKKKEIGTSISNKTIANNTQDTMGVEPYNKWIQTQISDDNLLIAHEVHGFNTADKFNIDLNTMPITGTTEQKNDWQAMTDGNTIKIPDWEYDAAGHIIAKQSRTYTLPYGYKQIVATNSDAVNVEPSTVTDKPTADNTQDVLNIKAANKWIKLNTTNDSATDGNSISFAHTLVGTNFGNTYYSNVDSSNTNDDHNRKLDFGNTFKIFNLTTDNAGHITNINTNDITLPTIALTNGDSGNMVTGISYSYNNTDHKGTFTETRANVGTLALTGYGVQQTEANKDTNIVTSSDSINTAFEKVESKINTFLQDASITEGAIDTLKELQEYIDTHNNKAADMIEATNNIYKNVEGTESGILINKTDALAERIDAINGEVSADDGKYISSIKIENDILSVGETSLPTYTLTTGDNEGTIKFNGAEVEVYGLGSAAYTDSTSYAKANILETKFDYGTTTEQKTIAELMNKVAELEAKLNELNNQINPSQEPDEGGETV